MKHVKCLYGFVHLILIPFFVLGQDNGNNFNLIWADKEIIGITAGFVKNGGEETYQQLQVVNDYDGNGSKEIVGWDRMDEHYFAIEATGNNSFGLKNFFQFFPYFIDLNDNGIDEAIHIDVESDPDSVVIQLVNYDAALDSFVIKRKLGKFVKPTNKYLSVYYVDKGNFDDDSNSEIVLFSYDRWLNPYGGIATYLVVFELTSTDMDSAGIKIEHLETISATRFQAPATVAEADLDHDGKREMVLVSIERKRMFIYESQGEDKYALVYETGNYAPGAMHTFKSFTYIGDLDKDGLDDIWYCDAHGLIYVLPGRGNYDSTFTYQNSFNIATIPNATEVRGGVFGDCDADGKPNMYWWDLPTQSIFEMEYQGGDLRNPANYIVTQIYQADLNDIPITRFEGLNIGGVRSGVTDLDNDGKRDFVIARNDGGDYQFNAPRLLIFESVHTATGVKEKKSILQAPMDYLLMSAFPNPSQVQTNLVYEIKSASPITLSVYNVCGQLVTQVERAFHPAGRYQVSLATAKLHSGIYFARLETKFGQKTVKLLVAR